MIINKMVRINLAVRSDSIALYRWFKSVQCACNNLGVGYHIPVLMHIYIYTYTYTDINTYVHTHRASIHVYMPHISYI